ncbi:MAG: hypothetical protein AVO33_01915 [delta proteobacterium ML8_F1]|nr:MAG: hypothetical protein AVO33_01915 [delta proteobacterium ML8_F1]
MKKLVVYQSKTGFAKQYAQWLAEVLEAEIIELKAAAKINFSDYDWVVFGGGVYASKINGLKKFKGLMASFKQDRVVVFAVGAVPKSLENTRRLMETNLGDWGVVPGFFYLEGGFDLQRLNPGMKLILRGMQKALRRKAEKNPQSLTEEEKSFLEGFSEKASRLDPGNIQEIVSYIGEGRR